MLCYGGKMCFQCKKKLSKYQIFEVAWACGAPKSVRFLNLQVCNPRVDKYNHVCQT